MMECQECHDNPATLHFTQIIHGEKNEVHVCEACAKEKGYMTYPEETYTLQNLLEGLFNFDMNQLEGHHEKVMKQSKGLQCSRCKLTLNEFKQQGKFGCATCYEVFSTRLDPILRRVHSGNTKHLGKLPKRQGGSFRLQREIKKYQEKLKDLVEKEAFEDAVIIRDKIKELKRGQTNLKEGEDS